MKARPVTYADLDALLQRQGFVKRRVEVDRGRVDAANGRIHGATISPVVAATVPGYVFSHEGTGAQVLLPLRPSDTDIASHHLHTVRRTLADWDVMSEPEFDRWLCQTRFPEDGDGTASVGVGTDQFRSAD